MKKILFAIITVLFSIITISCDNTQFGLAYGVQLTGDGDGQFEVAFPQGSYAMDGTASLTLNVGDTILFNDTQVTTKSEVIERGDKKQMKVMQQVNDSIATRFNAIPSEGTYDLWLTGYVKEIGTGLVFKVNRHITNREAVRKLAAAEDEDFCPYIQ